MKENSNLLPEWEEISATAMAVQNMWISCSGTSIGGYWSTPKYAKHLRSFLSLNENERCLGFFYLGVHDSNRRGTSRRKNILEKTEWFE
jgi:nitroreductase